MTVHGDDTEASTLSPDDAFVALGNETRIRTLRALQDAEAPLSFTELRNRVGIDDPGQFNYHLGKLRGHFVRDAGDGYEISRAGTRVIEAVLSGAVTDAPVLEPTRLDAPCPYCGADVEISYREERLLTRCTSCHGSFRSSDLEAPESVTAPFGTIALFDLPPVGLQSRSPREILDAAFRWSGLEYLTLAAGVCPRCSGTVTPSVTVCEAHEPPDDDLCDRCHARYAVDATVRCSVCPRYLRGIPSVFLMSKTAFSRFLTDHGINPINSSWERAPPAVLNYDETVVDTDPFAFRLGFTIDGDELVVTADDTLTVVGVDRDGSGANVSIDR